MSIDDESNATKSALPPGQRPITHFPRFGLPEFAYRFPRDTEKVSLMVGGDVGEKVDVSEGLSRLTRVEQVSDFHCVTTWSRRELHWGGYHFKEFYEVLVAPLNSEGLSLDFVVIKGQDGYRTTLPREDLMGEDVLLADRLDGAPLGMAHGAPLRLVAPAHYGYKNVKHLRKIEFWRDGANYQPRGLRFMAHPRARVALEERGNGAPGWFFRYLYRPTIRPAIALFARAQAKYEEKESSR